MLKNLTSTECKLLLVCCLAWVFMIATAISFPVIVHLERNSERAYVQKRELMTQRIIAGQLKAPESGYHDAWYYAHFSPQ